jgi:hypothetical protein
LLSTGVAMRDRRRAWSVVNVSVDIFSRGSIVGECVFCPIEVSLG